MNNRNTTDYDQSTLNTKYSTSNDTDNKTISKTVTLKYQIVLIYVSPFKDFLILDNNGSAENWDIFLGEKYITNEYYNNWSFDNSDIFPG